MAKELLDLVDEDGNPTGERAERELIHATGLRHRTAHLWLMRKRAGQAEILLQKRSADKDSYPNCYDISSAGHIPAGMDFIPSALRELEEELGLTATADELTLCGQRRFFHHQIFHGKPFEDHQVSNVYVMLRDVDPAELTLQTSEVQSVVWMPLCEVRRRVEAGDPAFCTVLEEVEILERAAKKLFPLFDNG
jgi:isopentenyldiphosphate isomerase